MDKRKVKKLKKSILLLILVFVCVFAFRLVYNYQYKDAPIEEFFHLEVAENKFDFVSKRNYASIKYKTSGQSNSANIDQKYEKVAHIKTVSSKFDQDEAKARNYIKNLNGLIQFEDKNGNEGHRRLSLTIGIPPENFDQLYQHLIKIGKIKEKQITKTDKTTEYNELKAKKVSLEKIRKSLLDLKSKNGKINEYMLLENRILEIEQQLQELGVSLGDFHSENEFCTVRLTINEGTTTKIGHLEVIKSALEWTIETYLKLILIFCLIALFAYLAILSIEKFKIISN